MDDIRSQESSCPWKSEVIVARRGFYGASNVLFLRSPGYRDMFSGRKFIELYTYVFKFWYICYILIPF